MDLVDGFPVPNALVNRVDEPEYEDVLHRLLAQIVVDAKDLLFVEDFMQHLVELARRIEIGPERLLDEDARPRGEVELAEVANHFGHGSRRHAR